MLMFSSLGVFVLTVGHRLQGGGDQGYAPY